jgi:hypothetical protein
VHLHHKAAARRQHVDLVKHSHSVIRGGHASVGVRQQRVNQRLLQSVWVRVCGNSVLVCVLACCAAGRQERFETRFSRHTLAAGTGAGSSAPSGAAAACASGPQAALVAGTWKAISTRQSSRSSAAVSST